VTAFGLYEHREDGYWVEHQSFPLGSLRPVPGERRDLR